MRPIASSELTLWLCRKCHTVRAYTESELREYKGSRPLCRHESGQHYFMTVLGAQGAAQGFRVWRYTRRQEREREERLRQAMQAMQAGGVMWMPDRWLCPICNHSLPEGEWSRLPRTMVEGECGSHTEITCPKCGRQTVGMAWVRVGWEPEADRIASCEAGHERITPAPKDWTEQAIVVMPPDDSEPFFPECQTCPEPGIGLIELMQGADGVLHKVRVCLIKFRDVEVG